MTAQAFEACIPGGNFHFFWLLLGSFQPCISPQYSFCKGSDTGAPLPLLRAFFRGPNHCPRTQISTSPPGYTISSLQRCQNMFRCSIIPFCFRGLQGIHQSKTIVRAALCIALEYLCQCQRCQNMFRCSIIPFCFRGLQGIHQSKTIVRAALCIALEYLCQCQRCQNMFRCSIIPFCFRGLQGIHQSKTIVCAALCIALEYLCQCQRCQNMFRCSINPFCFRGLQGIHQSKTILRAALCIALEYLCQCCLNETWANNLLCHPPECKGAPFLCEKRAVCTFGKHKNGILLKWGAMPWGQMW